MKVVVFGASGRTGKLLVEQALAAGHEVTAFVRDPSKLGIRHERLRVVQGKLEETEKVEQAIAGQDVVFSAVGPVRGERKDIMELAAKQILSAMKKHGLRRLVTLTGAGVPQPGDQPKIFDRLMRFLLGVLAKDVLQDSIRHAELVRDSGLDWTIVRVPVLTDGPARGNYRIGMVGVNSGARISRADVAAFMLKAATDKEMIGKAPVISY
ncbi:NmrA family protein [Allomeiothermus silvanus DSM 9946]|uniref:NmrA family protein n=1 Tax=Allomeiothermus silvanus (strain ATCC 700542 / DSM 9946 / NBRC 106475 / NCIMB 13440 / VI-R2) TaxID=526227 RepID=D7BBD9_ALLS1|nr:SDR family oxidoreductase [Allomeiothermus silvanus]ADH62699.1 NmrA family protein [Allomeiothermus silvanus DSM 9946]MBI5813337.1 SDR family oxidoreductase [Allomeiothermus silvanus]